MQHERRRFRRYRVKNGAYTVNASRPGLIVDISIGGMAFHYIDRKEWPRETFRLDIVFGQEEEFRLNDIPYRIVSDRVADRKPHDASLVVKRRSIEFGELSPEQRARLEYFIRHHATGRD
jgi:c-di-GMP-binding flagellar brake protein YcgR